MNGEKFVIKVISSEQKDHAAYYVFSHGLGLSPSCYLKENEIQIATKYAFKTRLGAESSILSIKRHYVSPAIDTFEYQCKHTKEETREWLNEKVENYDWENFSYYFEVITLEEMLNELEYNKKILF